MIKYDLKKRNVIFTSYVLDIVKSNVAGWEPLHNGGVNDNNYNHGTKW